MSIAIIGLGYVGLPLSLQFARSGVDVIGIDIDPAKIETLKAGKSYIKHVKEDEISAQVKGGRFVPSTDFTKVRECEAVIICVPTPLTKTREPDLSYVLDTGRAIAPHLRPGMLVVLESTTYPGTTEEDLRAVLEENAPFVEGEQIEDSRQKIGSSSPPISVIPSPSSSVGISESQTLNSQLQTLNSPKRPMRAGVDFFLAYSPEREDPGNPNSKVAKIPKVVGGLTSICLEKAVALYSRAVGTVVPVSSCKAAEATKLLENIFRSVNIALVNELKVIYAAMGIDIWEVIEAAKTKPFGFMPFYPGPGLGGHCIPIDPFYLTWKAREYGKHTRFIELAGEINTNMPEYVVNRVGEALNSKRKALNGSRVLVLGLAYKANVDDDRESPSYVLMEKLQQRGAEVAYHDPFVPVIRPSREHSHWAGTKSVPWDRETIGGFDIVLLSTAHGNVDYTELAQWAPLIVDTRNALSGITTAGGQVWSA